MNQIYKLKEELMSLEEMKNNLKLAISKMNSSQLEEYENEMENLFNKEIASLLLSNDNQKMNKEDIGELSDKMLSMSHNPWDASILNKILSFKEELKSVLPNN